MSTIAIEVTPPGGSPADITAAVLFAKSTFQQQMNAVPGNFTVHVRDPNRTLAFVTGSEISLEIDGAKTFGGYITQISLTHMAPAANTNDIEDYELRVWVLRGVDYNIIFDRRVWRNTADYLNYIDLTAFVTDGDILRELIANFADLSDFSDSGIEDIASIPTGDVVQQGEVIRKEFENLSYFGGAVWYIDANKNFVYKPYDDVEKRWGFSDQPNNNPITVSPAEYQGATIGYRSVEGVEDGTYIVNDALVWGGSQFAGSAGGTVFARVQDAASQASYGRWQVGETHFGERFYLIQDGVDARADVIVNGPPGADITGEQKGLRFTQWQFTFTWFGVDVPELSGNRNHIIPGDIVTIISAAFGVTKLLPLRQLTTRFPDALEDDGSHLVEFEGTFGLQLSDPFTLWRYILANSARVEVQTQAVSDDSSATTVYGAFYRGEPTPAPDSAETVFTLPFGYVPGTLQVFINTGSGFVLLIPGTDYTESDPEAGEFTMTVAPDTGDLLWTMATTTEG